MASRAVRSPKFRLRSSIAAVSRGSVPWSALRRTRLSSSSALRALASSSVGSTPKRCNMALALPFNTLIGQRARLVKASSGHWINAAVAYGLAIARFFGTSSPKIIVTAVANINPRAMAILAVNWIGMPITVSMGCISCAIAGSAKKPITRLVTVIPTWALESWVDNVFKA